MYSEITPAEIFFAAGNKNTKRGKVVPKWVYQTMAGGKFKRRHW